MEHSLEIRHVDHPLAVVLTLRGELDLVSVPRLEEQLDRAVRGGRAVVIDLSGLQFIDSSGLRILIRAEEQLRASDGHLVLVSGSPAVRRIFHLTRLDCYFVWCDSPTAALRTALERTTGPRGSTEPAADRATAAEVDLNRGGVMW